MIRILILLAVIGVVVLALVRPSPAQLRQYAWRAALAGGVLLLVVLLATGRLHWLAAVAASLVPLLRRAAPLLRYAPMLGTLLQRVRAARAGAGPAEGRRSEVRSDLLLMTLNHETGEMDGEVLAGPFQGRRLSEMTMAELTGLYTEARDHDPEAATLLATYLDRRFGAGWRDGVEGSDQGRADRETSASGAMTREEAYRILGLERGASREAIIEAHRRLMQRLHPDRGGSSHLAAQINRAKSLLLGE